MPKFGPILVQKQFKFGPNLVLFHRSEAVASGDEEPEDEGEGHLQERGEALANRQE